MSFLTSYKSIEETIKSIDPNEYAKTRNFADGAVTKLSPYISRGVISTQQIYQQVRATGISFEAAEKLIQELAWRDYWQQVWVHKGNDIFSDLKKPQSPVSNHQVPKAVVEGNTGIHAVDKAIEELKQTGYMHNHMRMYVAAICCNIAQCQWSEPAKWLYAHLLDGDLASNMLSWQWVAGSNANKKYYANQENINKYFYGNQKNTFLDVDYEDFEGMKIPEILEKTTHFEMIVDLSKFKSSTSIENRKSLIYNYYNLDPNWHKEEDFQRIFLIEPSVFEKYPASDKCLDFAIKLSENIENIKLFVGEFEDLQDHIDRENLFYKEHPLNKKYTGNEESRDWLSNVSGAFPSFFSFWKKVKKEIRW